jgi:hypothetical protein
MTIKQIRAAVENEFNLCIAIKGRQQKSVDARAIYSLLCRELTTETYKEIGKETNRKHEVVMYLEKKARYFIDVEPKYKDAYVNIKNRLEFPVKQEQPNVKIVERIVYTDSIQDLRDSERSILIDLKELSYSEISELHETRIKPYLSMLKTRVKHEVKETKGAKRKFSIN